MFTQCPVPIILIPMVESKEQINQSGPDPDFMSGMVDDFEYIPRNERLGRAGRLNSKRSGKYWLAIAAAAIVLIVVLAMAFDREEPPRETVASLNESLMGIEERLKALESKLARFEERAISGSPEKNDAFKRAGSETQYHIVQPGDSLSAIAAKYGITVDILCKLNRIKVDEPIKPAQKLLVSPN